jgi:hypothetical protein
VGEDDEGSEMAEGVESCQEIEAARCDSAKSLIIPRKDIYGSCDEREQKEKAARGVWRLRLGLLPGAGFAEGCGPRSR